MLIHMLFEVCKELNLYFTYMQIDFVVYVVRYFRRYSRVDRVYKNATAQNVNFFVKKLIVN